MIREEDLLKHISRTSKLNIIYKSLNDYMNYCKEHEDEPNIFVFAMLIKEAMAHE